jgi:hypothetical protein
VSAVVAAVVVIGGFLVSSGRSFADVPPAITSTANAPFTIGSFSSFLVTTTGTLVPSIKEKGKLPKDLTLTDNDNGTASLAGTPGATTGGAYPRLSEGVHEITIVATFGSGTTKQVLTQAFTLTVDQAPMITSRATKKARVGVSFSFAVKTRGYPTATIDESGVLPPGVTFTNNGNGTAILAGMPGDGSAGTYPITISASNGVGSPASQSYSLLVRS